MIYEINNNTPKFIVYVDLPMSIGYSDNAPNYMFKKIRAIIDSEYVLDSVVISSMIPEYYFGENFEKNSHKFLNPISNGIYLYKLKK